jgi:hypothetical protein
MQARKFKAVVHLGANESIEDATNESWLQLINDTLLNAGVKGVMLVVEPSNPASRWPRRRR